MLSLIHWFIASTISFNEISSHGWLLPGMTHCGTVVDVVEEVDEDVVDVDEEPLEVLVEVVVVDVVVVAAQTPFLQT